MTDRPSILSARVHQMGRAQACRSHLLSMAQKNRPSTASANEVESTAQDAIEDVLDDVASVAALQSIKCPCVRLGADSCLSHGGT